VSANYRGLVPSSLPTPFSSFLTCPRVTVPSFCQMSPNLPPHLTYPPPTVQLISFRFFTSIPCRNPPPPSSGSPPPILFYHSFFHAKEGGFCVFFLVSPLPRLHGPPLLHLSIPHSWPPAVSNDSTTDTQSGWLCLSPKH